MKFRFVACPEYVQFSEALARAREIKADNFRFKGAVYTTPAEAVIKEYPDLQKKLEEYKGLSSDKGYCVSRVIEWEHDRILGLCKLLKKEVGVYPLFTSLKESLEGQVLLFKATSLLKDLLESSTTQSKSKETQEVLARLNSYREYEAKWVDLVKYETEQGYTEVNGRVFTARSYGLNLHDVTSLIYDYYDPRSPYYSVMGRQILEKGAKEILESVFG